MVSKGIASKVPAYIRTPTTKQSKLFHPQIEYI